MKTILLIEDNMDIRENITEILFLEGYSVIPLNCGEDAIQLLQTVLPDLVLCDVVMPGIDGYSVYHAFRQNTEADHIPFIFMTAKSENIDRAKATSHGILHYLIKPFDEIELINCIKYCLETDLQKR